MANRKLSPKKPSSITFHISVSEPHLHYYSVEMEVDLKLEKTRLLMPTWSPGSYTIRDYSGHLHLLEAFDTKGKPLKFAQVDLSIWQIENNKKPFRVKYKIFGFENSVRTNFLDSEYGFINSPGLFLYPEKFLNTSIDIHFDLKNQFKFVYSPLDKKDFSFFAKSFDELYDSPFLLSNSDSYKYSSGNCVHEVVFEGSIQEKHKSSILKNLKVITDLQTTTFKGNPNSYYLFIILLSDDGYGGLEHKACSVNIFDSRNLDSTPDYNRLLALLCHEYFHLWNVKRIRPLALGPFDYQKPNLTKELWVAEGITSFYDNYFLLKTGIYSRNEYINEIVSDINKLEDNWGEDWMSLEESSFTAWTKYYKQTANSINTGISYYVKGSILTLCMNIYILEKSNLAFDFMDLLLYLYKTYAVKKDKGFTKEEFYQASRDAIGIDLHKEFETYISNTNRIPVDRFLEKIGIKITKTGKKNCLPFETKTVQGREIIKTVRQNKYRNLDISMGDEIIAICGERIDKERIEKWRTNPEEGQDITLLINRRNKILERKMKCEYFFSYVPDFSIPFDEIIDKNPIAKRFFSISGVNK